MSPIEIITLLQVAVRFGTEVAEKWHELLNKAEVTPEEVKAALALTKKGEEDYKRIAREKLGIPQP